MRPLRFVFRGARVQRAPSPSSLVEGTPARNCAKTFAPRDAPISIAPMPDAYQQLLDAAIAHLEELRATGRRFVAVSPAVLAGLSAQAPARGTIAAPISAPSVAP